MCRMTFAAIAVFLTSASASAQTVPGRDLFRVPLGTLAEAQALANGAGGGFWNPATISLGPSDRMLFSATAYNAPIEQGLSAQLATAAFRLYPALTLGFSAAESRVGDLLRTDTDPQSIGDEIPYRSTIVSAMLAGSRGPAVLGIALRRRSGTVDFSDGHATSFDVGATITRPNGWPVRAALSSFLVSPSHFERSSGFAAVEGFLPVAVADTRIGLAYELDETGGDEKYLYASSQYGVLDVRAGLARQTSFSYSTNRLRLGVAVHYGRYEVGVAREDGASGLGASYQFLLTTRVPMVSR